MTRTPRFWIAAFAAMTLLTVRPAAGQSWQRYDVAPGGEKPTIALNADGVPHIAYMVQSATGYLDLAVFNADADSFEIERAVDGYFFGPAALAFDDEGYPHVNYHDHATGNQQHVFETGQGWVNEPIQSSGHDGWDNSMVIDPQGIVHTSSIDPVVGGVEYAYSTPGAWVVESTGSNRLPYGYGTSLAIDQARIPHIAYFDNDMEDLMLASRTSGWQISAVDTTGDVGRFPALKIDSQGGMHITYYRDLGNAMGLIEYAYNDGSGWSFSTIDKLDDVLSTTAGYMTSLDLDSGGRPHVAYGDRKVVRYAYLVEDVWQRETVADLNRTPVELGQLASIGVDDGGVAHVAYYEDTSAGAGGVKYARRGSAAILAASDEAPPADIRLDVYPNPASTGVTILSSGSRAAETKLTIHDVLGRRVYATAVDATGVRKIQFERGVLGPGWYVVTLAAGRRSEHRALIVQ